MKQEITKRGKIRVFSLGTALLCVLLTFAIIGNVRAAKLQRQVRLSSERALCELDTYLSTIYTDLQKGIYTVTPPMLGSLSEELHRAATGAKTSLSVLPLSGVQMDNTYKFLSQVGDFVATLNGKAQRGEKITDAERTQMQKLLNFSQTLTDEISQMRTQLFDGYLDFAATNQTLSGTKEKAALLSDDMEDAEQSLTEYPSLIYDGPFSDHILQKDATYLADKPSITRDEALEKAAKILKADKAKVEFVSEETDSAAAYCFRYDDTVIAVTERGGCLLYMLSSAFVGESTLGYGDARKYAAEFLTQNGFFDMQESYYSIADGICTVNYAYKDGEYICYPDLIKVSVSLADGKILSVDCRGYMMNHKDRNMPAPSLPAAEAQKSVSPLLTVTDTRLAVIPTDSGAEKYAYEFHCKNKDGAEFLVYIDTETGYEDDILILLYADGGVLTK